MNEKPILDYAVSTPVSLRRNYARPVAIVLIVIIVLTTVTLWLVGK